MVRGKELLEELLGRLLSHPLVFFTGNRLFMTIRLF
jgi:hypothetical protein